MTSYKAEDIKARLLEFAGLMTFEHNGMDCSIDPFNPDLFHVTCAGNEQDVLSIDDVMNKPLFGGACLNDIAGQVKMLDW